MRARVACLICLLLGPLGQRPAGAQATDGAPISDNRSPYELDLGVDLGVTVGSLLVLGLPHLFQDQLGPPWCGLDCDPADVNRFDRTVIGNHSRTARIVSDAGVYSSWALPVVLSAVDLLASEPVDGWGGWGKDMVVLAETLAVTSSANVLLKFAFRRPRPLVYDDVHFTEAYRLKDDAGLSFPSGHTATAFAMATAYSYTFTRRHPDSPLVYPVWIGTYALAGLTGVMRTQAGRHFWTDVIAGAALGAGLGLLIPWLHLRDGPAPDPDQGSGLDVVLGPLALPDGLGAVLVFR